MQPEIRSNRRRQNFKATFDLCHPFRFTHMDQVRSLQVTPTLNRRTPRLPKKLSSRESPEKNDAALFYLTLFSPVDSNTGNLIDLESNLLLPDVKWKTFLRILRFLVRPTAIYSQRKIANIINRMNASLVVQTAKKNAITKFSYLGTTPWQTLEKQESDMIQLRKMMREGGNTSIPPESAYQNKQQNRFRTDDDDDDNEHECDENSNDDTNAIMNDLTRRQIGGETTTELNI